MYPNEIHQKKNHLVYFTFFITLFFGSFILSTQSVNAAQGTVEYCQKVSDKIRYYSSLRKLGGSAKKMENWKQQRKKYKEKFTNRNCKQWKDQLEN